MPERGAFLPRHAGQIAGREHDLVALELVAGSGLRALGILEAPTERLGADRSSGTLQAFAAVGITTTKSGEPRYGCEGSPVAFCVWRPPATA